MADVAFGALGLASVISSAVEITRMIKVHVDRHPVQQALLAQLDNQKERFLQWAKDAHQLPGTEVDPWCKLKIDELEEAMQRTVQAIQKLLEEVARTSEPYRARNCSREHTPAIPTREHTGSQEHNGATHISSTIVDLRSDDDAPCKSTEYGSKLPVGKSAQICGKGQTSGPFKKVKLVVRWVVLDASRCAELAQHLRALNDDLEDLNNQHIRRVLRLRLYTAKQHNEFINNVTTRRVKEAHDGGLWSTVASSETQRLSLGRRSLEIWRVESTNAHSDYIVPWAESLMISRANFTLKREEQIVGATAISQGRPERSAVARRRRQQLHTDLQHEEDHVKKEKAMKFITHAGSALVTDLAGRTFLESTSSGSVFSVTGKRRMTFLESASEGSTKYESNKRSRTDAVIDHAD